MTADLYINNPNNNPFQVLLDGIGGSKSFISAGGSSPGGTVALKPEEAKKLAGELSTALAELAGLIVKDQCLPHSPSWYAGVAQTAGQSSVATFLQYFQTMTMVVKICNELQQLTTSGANRMTIADQNSSGNIASALWGLPS
jgi:hypothetical protein